MLIIFDLDDTLVDTSGTLTPVQLKKALWQMKQEGLVIHNFTKELNRLYELDQKSPSARDTIKNFLKGKDLNKKFFSIGIQTVYYDFSKDLTISALAHAKKVLKVLFKKHQLAIVSSGKKEIQILKLEKAGIEPSLFSRIEVTPTTEKKPLYKRILEETTFCTKDILICGDKVQVDLVPAKELGFTTVHILSGRGKRQTGKQWVDYTIHKLPELLNIVEGL